MNITKIKTTLTREIAADNIIENVPMAQYTSFRAGGCADLLVKPDGPQQLALRSAYWRMRIFRIWSWATGPTFLSGTAVTAA